MMKRSSSFDDCAGGNGNSGGYQHNNNNSMSMPTKTDQQCVEGGDATKGSGSSALSSTHLAIARAASYGSTNEKQSINNNNNNMKNLVRKYSSSNNSHGFVSDTDGEESELHGMAGAGGRTTATQSSSQLDYQKKRLYTQRLREFDRNANNCDEGDTSLSSSNMSPTPQRFRIHFDNTTATSSVSSSIQSGGKKVKNKVVATRSHCSITNANNPNRLRLELSNINATTDHDEQIAIGEGMHIGEDICSQSTSASDSVVGAKVITTEQYGGETTASDSNQLNIKQWQEQQHHQQQQQSQPDSDLIKRSKRKQQGEQKGELISRPHRRVRSGDDWAATIMNPNRDEHWMGMKKLQVVGINKSLPSVPLAERGLSPTSLTWSNNSNDEASSLTRNNSSSLSFQQQQQQSSSVRSQGATSILSNSRDGYSAGSSHVTSHRNNEGFIPSGHEQQQRATTRGHSHNKTLSTTFDFSDDSGTGSGGTAGDGNNIGSRSGGASGSIPHSSNRLSWDGNDNRRGGYHHVRYASQVIQPVNQPGYINPNMTWLYSYQQSNSHRPIRYDAIDQQTSKEEDNGRSSFSSDGDDDDDDGGSSCMSSSYTDNSTRMIEIEARRAGLPDQLNDHKHHHHHKRVHFRSLEDTKFDKVMKRVQSVLDKPLYRLDKVNTNGEDDEHNKNIPMFYCPNCKTHQRDFINFATASEGYDSPQGYLVFYFALYLLSSLFIFGLEEGWAPLDCFYFSVITLTTAVCCNNLDFIDFYGLMCILISLSVAHTHTKLGSWRLCPFNRWRENHLCMFYLLWCSHYWFVVR